MADEEQNKDPGAVNGPGEDRAVTTADAGEKAPRKKAARKKAAKKKAAPKKKAARKKGRCKALPGAGRCARSRRKHSRHSPR
ncbi:MAG: hypothetical protein C3L25_11845 [Candidatus Sedimenticola endophacoides]|uniref:Uncharacterized protein n=1 Tax=Candidatus Sedimenticola endophacoides TaxID=2548426 RepID=A0A6N4DYE7_9GAMM|nr:MAG: hypothetical protein C3L26_11940 [Candidatus Sedimenticola endophacoides]PUE01778.1 MAG: hypothetical protein C3L25_11845 [Candidatus Sedimenticola endophacoides]PUE04890.1 MAG: hypothetical protein C3L24_02305 [Candidatus Sedimenticola endophacoides]